MRRAPNVTLLAILLSGCSFANHERAAWLFVAQFHSLLNSGDFDEIAADADPKMTWPQKGPTFRQYLEAVHRKLGLCGKWQMASYVEQFGTKGHLAQLSAKTACEKGDAQESFVLSVEDPVKLHGYAITSPALVVS